MTERVLPGIPLPARSRHVARPAVPDASAHARRGTLVTAPVRAALLLGGSGAVYAVSLAGMAGLQSRSDGELAARSAPYVEALEATRARNDALDATIRGMDAAARSLAGGYAATADAIAAYEARLDSLASLVAEVQGSAAALPARIALPSVTVRGAGAPAKAPRTSATSGGSGG